MNKMMMKVCQPRSSSSASRILSRCNRCRIREEATRQYHKLEYHALIPKTAVHQQHGHLLASWDSISSSTDNRYFSTLFRNSLMQNESSNEKERIRKSADGFGSSSSGPAEYVGRDHRQNEPRRGQQQQFINQSNTHQKSNNYHNRNQQQQTNHQRPRNHSTRLVSESAARQTTQLFMDAYTKNAPWEDGATLVAAEHALEFWANRNNINQKQQQRTRGANQNNIQLTLEKDAETALRLFEALQHFHSLHRVLNNGMYSHVIDALAKSPNVDHVQKADVLLRQFTSLYIRYTTANMDYRKEGVHKLLQAVESNSPHQQQLTMPDTIQWNKEDKHHWPNQIRITGVMRGYARHSSPHDAEALLQMMLVLSSSTFGNKHRMFRPNEVGYATVIDAYARTHDGVNAERVLELMKTRHGSTEGAPTTANNGANVVAYNATISAWARCAKQQEPTSSKKDDNVQSPMPSGQAAIIASRAAAENAERLLREMLSEHDEGRHSNNSTLQPDVVTFATVISAFATCLDQPHGMKRARELLKELEGLAAQEYNDDRNSATAIRGNGRGGGRNANGFQPNTVVYNTILQAYANAGDSATAEGILQSMISLHSSSLKEGGRGGPYQNIRPNTRTFNIVLNAWAKSNGGDGGTRAHEILERMENLASSNKGPHPDIISYNTVLAAWSKSASVDPTTLSEKYEEHRNSKDIVGKDAAYEALRLLDRLEQQCIHSQRNSSRHQHNNHRPVKPDVISYNTTISAIANAAQHCQDGVSIADEAESLLPRMKDRVGIEPDAYSYNGVISAWARSSSGLTGAKRAESILRSMREPTIVSWSSVINAYALADGASRAEDLLREMEHLAVAPRTGSSRSPTPTVVLYNNVLHAWSRSSDSDASKHSEVLLDRMESSPELPKADVISYRTVLTTLEHSLDHDKAERAKTIMSILLESVDRGANMHIKPREIQNVYNSVIAACAYTPAGANRQHREKAARILVETLRDMNHYPWPDNDSIKGPNQESYALFLQGCTHLFEVGSEERSILMKAAFHECCQRGLLNSTIWNKLCSGLRPEMVKAFVRETTPSSNDGDIELKFEDLPSDWSRNVRKRCSPVPDG